MLRFKTTELSAHGTLSSRASCVVVFFQIRAPAFLSAMDPNPSPDPPEALGTKPCPNNLAGAPQGVPQMQAGAREIRQSRFLSHPPYHMIGADHFYPSLIRRVFLFGFGLARLGKSVSSEGNFLRGSGTDNLRGNSPGQPLNWRGMS
jgi:hypothetical protein